MLSRNIILLLSLVVTALAVPMAGNPTSGQLDFCCSPVTIRDLTPI